MAMQAAEDPYSAIRDEISSEIKNITSLQAQLFSGHAQAKQQLRQAFADVHEQLSALEAAVKHMVYTPSKFNLDSTTAFMRQVEVETLRFQLDDLQRTCNQVHVSSNSSSSSKPDQHKEVEMHKKGVNVLALPHHVTASSSSARAAAAAPVRHSKLVQQQQQQHDSSCDISSSSSSRGQHPASSSQQQKDQGKLLLLPKPPPAAATASKGAASTGWTEYTAAAAAASNDDTKQDWDTYEGVVQQQIMQQQDEALEHIAVHVDRIKEQGYQMHDELEQQSLLLNNLQEDTDTSHVRLRSLRKKVGDVIKQSRQDRQLCLIITLSFVLVILTVIALA